MQISIVEMPTGQFFLSYPLQNDPTSAVFETLKEDRQINLFSFLMGKFSTKAKRAQTEEREN